MRAVTSFEVDTYNMDLLLVPGMQCCMMSKKQKGVEDDEAVRCVKLR